MNYFFAGLSAAYIFVIFFWADSSAVKQISVFNPMSLLHIPLYGILTVLLILALKPGQKNNFKSRYALAALIALGVAIFDEFHQSFIPTREASGADILLDVIGVFLAITISHFFLEGYFNRRKKI
ncbi:MAG: hypothetical protein FJ117_23075 [Deltaproteobacteria bacterium]|nr:hypothetical protein [Deltaproteobacteria bacterium]